MNLTGMSGLMSALPLHSGHSAAISDHPIRPTLSQIFWSDGKGAWRDNVFVERFWRTIKYEEVYLRAYDGVEEVRQSIGRYIAFYNARRPHAALDGRTPDQAYSHPLPLRTAA